MTYCTDRFTRLDYCQFLVSSPLNYSITHFADHAKKWSHDTINRYLKGEKIPPRFLWEKVKDQIVPSEEGYLIFDDTVLDKNHSRQIETVRSQWSGNAKKVIRGIGVVTCVYVNPEADQFWSIDYRIYDPEVDGKTKIDHLREMLSGAHYQKKLPFQAVLMDTWYASREVMRHIEKLEKVYFCPIKPTLRTPSGGGATFEELHPTLHGCIVGLGGYCALFQPVDTRTGKKYSGLGVSNLRITCQDGRFSVDKGALRPL